MRSKIYLKDLSLDEILDRLDKGQKLYVEDANDYYQKISNTLIRFVNDTLVIVGASFEVRECALIKYFLDEVEEPEADESCIDKLCWFWCDNEYAKCVDILTEIKTEETYKYRTKSNVWKHCRPLTKEEALTLIKE